MIKKKMMIAVFFLACAFAIGNALPEGMAKRAEDTPADAGLPMYMDVSKLSKRESEVPVDAGFPMYMETPEKREEKVDDMEKRKSRLHSIKPHIIMILIDDFGFNDIPWNNQDVKMPYTMELATGAGKILNHAYSSHVCSPSRGTLMSGLYAHKIAMSHNVYTDAHPECLKTDVELLPAKLKTNGYATHMVGKWHLGFCGEMCLPTGRGFDTFYGFYHGADSHYGRETTSDTLLGYDWHDVKAGVEGGSPDNGKARDTQYYSQDLVTERSVQLINEHPKDEPLFLFFSSPLTHTPLQVDQKYIDEVPVSVGSERRRIFIAMCKALDDSIKTLVTALKDNGLYDDSVIIFHADNGGQENAGSNAPLRGAKASSYEGGIRVPSFIHSTLLDPSQQGTVDNGLFYIADWTRTILEIAQIDDKLSEGLDGLKQHRMLFHGHASQRTEFISTLDIIPPMFLGEGMLRMGDFKLIVGWPGIFDGWEGNDTLAFAHDYDIYNVVDTVNAQLAGEKRSVEKRGEYNWDFALIARYVMATVGKYQLFNVIEDPFEEHNLVDSHPEKLAELQARYAEHKKDFFMFNIKAASINTPAGMPENNNGDYVTGWCPDGPANMDI